MFPNFNGVHCIRANINQVDPDPSLGEFAVTLGAANAKHVGTIPKNSLVLPLYKVVTEAFNGTTPTLSIGSEADPDGFGTSAAIAPGTPAAMVAVVAGALTGRTTEDVEVFVEATTAGGTQTTGAAELLLLFYPCKN